MILHSNKPNREINIDYCELTYIYVYNYGERKNERKRERKVNQAHKNKLQSTLNLKIRQLT